MKLVAVAFLAALVAEDLSAQIDIQVSPTNPVPGQTVTMKLTNLSSQTWNLPTLCVFRDVHETGVAGPTVLNLICGGALKPVPPGQSVSQGWDQTDNSGQPVPPGTYALTGFIFDPNFAKVDFAAQVVISSCPTPPSHYGPVSAGAGGVAPKVGNLGEPQVGNNGFTLQLADTVGGATGVLVVGTANPTGTPVGWGTFLLNPGFPVIPSPPIPFSGTPGSAGEGFVNFLAPIPNTPSLAGVTASMQLLAGDAQSSGGIAHSRGFSITICP